MSSMLDLIGAGWEAARSLAQRGRAAPALAQLTRLLSHPDLPIALAADAHRLAAELEMEFERYAKARRHLRAASSLEPNHAHTHYLSGLSCERDPHGDDGRAASRFKKASDLEPANALYRSALGRAAVRSDRLRFGVRNLLAAARAALDNLAVLHTVVDGLLAAGKARLARRVLDRARFLHGGDAIRRLRERVSFEAARLGQRELLSKQGAPIATDGDFLVVPFIRVVGPAAPRRSSLRTIRHDAISAPRPHLARLGFMRTER